MIKTQKIAIGNGQQTENEIIQFATQNGCVAYFFVIPPYLSQIAKAENWTFPRIFVQTWDEPDPIV
jgi:hypothetical protein